MTTSAIQFTNEKMNRLIIVNMSFEHKPDQERDAHIQYERGNQKFCYLFRDLRLMVNHKLYKSTKHKSILNVPNTSNSIG